jgi:hypothetical protein
MFGRRHSGVLAPLKLLALTAAILVTAFAGAAIAGGSSVHVNVARHVRKGVAYAITMRGFAAGKERLYLFVDYYSCGSTPAVEHSSHAANGDYWTVHGHFVRISKDWHSSLKAVDHACVYLVRLSAPINSSTGVVAHAFRGYKIR